MEGPYPTSPFCMWADDEERRGWCKCVHCRAEYDKVSGYKEKDYGREDGRQESKRADNRREEDWGSTVGTEFYGGRNVGR